MFDTPDSGLMTDGGIDFRIRVRDPNSDGVPDYEVRRFRSPWPSYTFAQVWISVNESTGQPPDRDSLAWPYLSAHPYGFLQRAGEINSPIQMDWESGRIVAVAEFVPSHASENSWYIQSFAPAKEGEAAALNLENPMAYYDLAADGDGRPELNIRLEHYPAYDGFLEVAPSSAPQNDVRYSWNQDNSPDLVWDYKVGLAGRNPVTTTVKVDDLSAKSIPYTALPYWISDNTWAWGTFVAREGQGYPSSEGIYEWAAVDAVQTDMTNPDSLIPKSQLQLREYLHGLSTTPPDRFYQEIRGGLRAEFGHLQDRPYLYMSPIDAKLHLRKAMQGAWNIADGAEIRYADRDRDFYLDQWQYFEGGQLRRQLNVLQDYMIYFDPIDQTVQLKRTRVTPALFETLPPRDHGEWLDLGEQLDKYRRDFAPGDFASMAAQFVGPTTEVQGASIRDLRVTSQGLRFVLELQAGFSVPLDQEGLASLLDAPGAYVVTYDGKAWSARSSTPVSLRISGLQANTQDSALTALGWNTAEAIIRNDGLEDSHNLLVCAVFDGPEEHQIVVTDTVALLPGEGQQRVTWDWAPPAAGRWDVRVAAPCIASGDAGDATQALATTTINVLPRQGPSWQWLLTLGNTVPMEIILLFAGTALLAGGIAGFWLLAATRHPQARDAAPPRLDAIK
jgi:hypothetical protein